MRLEDLILFTAMGPPGGGRSVISPRIVRHFNVLAYTELDEKIVKEIFTTLIDSFLAKFSPEVLEIIPTLVDSVLVIFDKVRNELLPTPSKSHYTFNLRDISKVFQGICSASSKYCPDVVNIIRLWHHENMRVFHDRLTTEDDRIYFKNLLADEFKRFGLTKNEVLNVERIIFGDFMQGREIDPKHYLQIEIKQLIDKMNMYQEDYNAESAYSSSKL